MLRWIKKLFGPRRPFLPLRSFDSGLVIYTRADWERYMSEEYPVRFFVTETLPRWFRYLMRRKDER